MLNWKLTKRLFWRACWLHRSIVLIRFRSLPFVVATAILGAGGLLVAGSSTQPSALAQGAGYSLRFYGNGVGAPDQDRVKIRIDDPANSLPGPPADVGATDFTIEFWMKASAADNTAGPVACGANINWIYGNIVFDRDRYSQDRKFGLSIAGGNFVFGVTGDGTGDRTICAVTSVLDNQWHHIAVQRRLSDGWMWLFIDGAFQSGADGPDGDISYPDDGVPGNYCGGPCTNSDPFIVLGAEKHDAGAEYPSYNGYVDEMRLSTVLRYPTNGGSFTRPSLPFTSDGNTAALYHFDEGPAGECPTDTVIDDVSGASGGPSNGFCRYGGSPAGPVLTTDTPFGNGGTPTPTSTPTKTPTPTGTPTPTPTLAVIGTPEADPLSSLAIVQWQTNILADSRVRFELSNDGCDPPWSRIVTHTLYALSHSVVLTGLQSGTAYCYEIQSSNGVSTTAWIAGDPFTTLFQQFDVYLPLILKAWESP